jgi:resuscitation-promoting factor RpfB
LAQAFRRPASGGLLTERWHIRHELLAHARRFRSRHHAAAIAVVLAVALLVFPAFPGHDVVVVDSGRAYRVSTTFDPRSEALAHVGIRVVPGDRVALAETGRFASVAVIEATDVRIVVDGRAIVLRTQVTSAGGALAAAGISLRPGDLVYIEGQLAAATAPLSGVRFSSATAPANDAEAGVLDIAVVRARPFAVYVDETRVEVSTAADTVSGLLADLGLVVREGDLVQPPLDSRLVAGQVVRLEKARTVHVTLNGQPQALYTQAETVQDVLNVLGIALAPGDILSLPAETPVLNGMTLEVGTTEIGHSEVVEMIPPYVYQWEDPNLPAGEVRIIGGKPGERVVRYEVTYHNGQETQRRLLGSSVSRAAVAAQHIVGTKAVSGSRTTVSTGDFVGTYTRKLNVWATWYNETHGPWTRDHPAWGTTATGARLAKGLCAVDPTVIPLGTRFVVPGYGMCLAADVGGGIKGNKVDLGFTEAHGDNPWATGFVDIYILD